MTIARLNHAVLYVRDATVAARFYVDVLGCSVAGRAALPRTRTSAIGLGAGDIALVWLQTATGERIKLLQPSDAPAPAAHDDHLTARRGVAYLTFHVDDLVARSAAAVGPARPGTPPRRGCARRLADGR